MYLFIILYMFLLTSSLKINPKHVKQNFCVNCKYFIPDNNGKNEFGKCGMFPSESQNYLIDGIIREDEYYYCSTARQYESLCGKDGAKYKNKNNRKKNNNRKKIKI